MVQKSIIEAQTDLHSNIFKLIHYDKIKQYNKFEIYILIFKLILLRLLYHSLQFDDLHSNIFKLIQQTTNYSDKYKKNLHSNIFKLIQKKTTACRFKRKIYILIYLN